MKEDTTPADRLTTLRNILDKTQAEFAKEIGITQSALSQIETGNRKISTDALIKITEKYNVNADWLLHGRDSAFKTQKVAATSQKVQPIGEGLIPLVDKEAHADYPTHFQDDEYIKKFDVYRIPGFEEGTFRMFEVVGDSMEPTLFENEYIITELVENYQSIGNGNMYVLVSEKGIVVKRVYFHQDGEDAYILKSDNVRHKSFKILPKELKQAWEVKGKITNKFLNLPLEGKDRISELESRMEKLEKLLRKHLK